jgi:hypothetical protein
VEIAEEQYLSALPFLPLLSEQTLNTYYTYYALFITGVIVFGGVLAPMLEVKLGLGGTVKALILRRICQPQCSGTKYCISS